MISLSTPLNQGTVDRLLTGFGMLDERRATANMGYPK
ncbi:hypothetical protein GP2143_04595 [marine gamma proteobacterium HTCC2143]|uniref:Uncharacterized protein n=1 Tax=marine gamma proteobacterium HTCC2143 TaxID=247633 RepID=A0YAW9_9GAMM|nr:hypothetical protein GP2143_04595 [marine gamma proteobacterium HTCC2143]